MDAWERFADNPIVSSATVLAEDCRVPVGRCPCRDSLRPFESKRGELSLGSERRFSVASIESLYIAPAPGPCLSRRAAASHASGCSRWRRSKVAVGCRAWFRYWCDPQIIRIVVPLSGSPSHRARSRALHIKLLPEIISQARKLRQSADYFLFSSARLWPPLASCGSRCFPAC